MRLSRRLSGLLAAVGLAVSGLACGGSDPAPITTPQLTGLPPHAGAPFAGWLGLDYNSGPAIGSPGYFAARGVVYDRNGALEVRAGHTVTNSPELAHGLAVSLGAGLMPDVYVNPAHAPVGCTGDPNGVTKFCLPVSQADIASYVREFIATATSIRLVHPGRRIMFEPMNEPWTWAYPPGTPSGQPAATQYAAVLARLLPAARAAGLPLSDVYVPLTGTLLDGTAWVSDLYRAQPCLRPGPGTCGPIEGWSAHPYGLPHLKTEGIGMLPAERSGMLSGRNNIIVSEIGFCASDVNGGQACDQNRSDIVGTSRQAAGWLAQTLIEALPMHRAGWLRALMIWNRGSGGWAMQNPDGSLTTQGALLLRFATAR